MSVQLFIEEFNKISRPVEGCESMRHYKCANDENVEVEIFENEQTPNSIFLDHIGNFRGKKGNGREALQALLSLSNKYNVTLITFIASSRENYDNNKLKNWYKENGFIEMKQNKFIYSPY